MGGAWCGGPGLETNRPTTGGRAWERWATWGLGTGTGVVPPVPVRSHYLVLRLSPEILVDLKPALPFILWTTSHRTVWVTEAELLAMLESPLYVTVIMVEPTGNVEVVKLAARPLS